MGGPALKNAGGVSSKKTTLYSHGGIRNNTGNGFRAFMGMRPKTLLALVVLAHALGHPLVHTLPVLTATVEQAQGPSSSPSPAARVNGSVPCAACLGHRLLPEVMLLASALEPEWEPVTPASQARAASFLLVTRPARAPPEA